MLLLIAFAEYEVRDAVMHFEKIIVGVVAYTSQKLKFIGNNLRVMVIPSKKQQNS